ncbi:MAG: SPOR domain-containing protein [Lewinellaceae bacterium]|nr:SPOR domain-containing protein [Lewinellaceae bacterium]
MRNTNVFTIVLYGLIGLVIILAGFKACDIRSKSIATQKAKEDFLDETISKVPYIDPDSTIRQSSFDTDTSKQADGIEYDKPNTSKPNSGTSKPGIAPVTTKPTVPPATNKPSTTSPKPAAPKTVTPAPLPTAKPAPSTSPSTSNAPPVSSGKYVVVTGAFKSIANARDEMEALVKMGYQNAEVKSLASGYYHAIATRSNDKAAAQKIADQLKTKGFAKAYVRTGK